MAAEAEEGTPADARASGDTSRYMAQASVGVQAAMITSLLFAVGIFFVLPLVLVGWADHFIAADWGSNLLEGVIRLALLLAYMVLIGACRRSGASLAIMAPSIRRSTPTRRAAR